MPPVFRMLPKMIAHWKFTKGSVDEHSRVLKNCTPPFNKLNGYVFVWFRLMLSGACNTHQVTTSVSIVLHLENYECLEQLSTAFENYGSCHENLHTVSKHFMLEDGDRRFLGRSSY